MEKELEIRFYNLFFDSRKISAWDTGVAFWFLVYLATGPQKEILSTPKSHDGRGNSSRGKTMYLCER